tara:strand:+ start:74 stop:208 length:135 start_codon:yes stop_codon:yes gene_type:complete
MIRIDKIIQRTAKMPQSLQKNLQKDKYFSIIIPIPKNRDYKNII